MTLVPAPARRHLLRAWALGLSLATAVAAAPNVPQNAPQNVNAAARGATKTLRYSFPVAETSFDPAQISDLYSRTVVGAVLEAPLEFEFLATPVRLRPNTAAAMPEAPATASTMETMKVSLRQRDGATPPASQKCSS
jgi:hypothetical protein